MIGFYGEANERNEYSFSNDVNWILSQIEIYDRIWYLRNPTGSGHSEQGKEIIRDVIRKLQQIPDGCAECFPFDLIDELTKEYIQEQANEKTPNAFQRTMH